MLKQRFTTPPLEWVRAFEAAARCGSFTAAAAEIGITQSAMSQRIGQLEKNIGTPLFVRRARSIQLTIEGEAWLPHVQTALSTLRDSSEALFGATRTRLTLSASQSVIQLRLLPVLDQLQDISGGQLTLQTMVLGAHDLPADDTIGIRYGTGDWPLTYKRPLYPERIAPLAAPQILERTDPWTTWPRIACSGPRPDWHAWSSQFGTATTPVPHLRCDTFLSALEVAKAGHGVVLGSLALCATDVTAGRLVQLGDDVLEHHATYWLTAGKEALSRQQWDQLSAVLCTDEGIA